MFCLFITIMEINKDFLNQLFEQAKENPRLRQNLDLRTSAADNSQRMLNALLPGTIVPIHRHPHSTENVFLLCGKIVEVICDENGNETKRIELDPAIGNYGCVVPQGPGIRWRCWNLRLSTKQRTESTVKMVAVRWMNSRLSKQRMRHRRNKLHRHSAMVWVI